MFTDDVFQRIPNFRLITFHHQFCCLNGRCLLFFDQLLKDKRLEQFQSHSFGQTTLMQTQGRTNYNHRATGIIYPLTKKVLTEAALLTLDHVRQRFQWTFIGTGNGTSPPTVIQQGIYRLLQHPFFVTHDNIRRKQLQQTFQAVVAINDATIKIIQIGCGKATRI